MENDYFPEFLFETYNFPLVMSSNNITIWTTITVSSTYLPDAIWNLSGVVWGWFPNIFILIVGLFGKVNRRFKYSIVGMSACQLYAVITQTLLYTIYIWANAYKIEMTILMCSIPRRFLQQTINVALLSLLIISLDRYLSIVHGKVLQKRVMIALFFIPALYAHGVYNTLTIIPMQIGTSDMCGPCLKMPPTISPYFEPVVPVCLTIAILLNIRILWFLYNYKRNRQHILGSILYHEHEITDMKQAMIGVTLQVCIPMIFNMPQVINLAMYNIKATFRLDMDIWRVINCLNYFSLCLNPCVTLIFVKQFRLAALKFMGKDVPSASYENHARIAPTVMIISH